jgi:hypothetical protein
MEFVQLGFTAAVVLGGQLRKSEVHTMGNPAGNWLLAGTNKPLARREGFTP